MKYTKKDPKFCKHRKSETISFKSKLPVGAREVGLTRNRTIKIHTFELQDKKFVQ